jgi:hypothetical protein
MEDKYYKKYFKYKLKYLELKQSGGGYKSLFRTLFRTSNKEIVKDDIMYEDDLVCILKPNVKKGIIIWTNYTQPQNMDSLCNLGLKSGIQMKTEDLEFGRSKIHPYIFFRAPYFSRDIDYTSIETEITSSFGQELIGKESRVFIRVDPKKTFVFASEIRVKFNNNPQEYLEKSRKTLSDYLTVIKDNLEIEKNIQPDKQILYNLITSKAQWFLKNTVPDTFSPDTFSKYRKKKITERDADTFDKYPINRHSEILVSIPHLTPDYFVLCTVSK